MSLSRSRKSSGALIALAVAVVVVAGALAGCGGSSSGGDVKFTGNGYPGVDTANSRFVKGPINSSNANQLETAWTLPLEAESTYGAYASTPVVAGGALYSQDLESNVQAIDLESGDVLWEKTYNEADQGPNGVVVAEGMVFGATPTKAFALDQESGDEVWSTPLLRSGNGEGESIDMAPGYHEGLVYVSTTPTNASSSYPGGGVGILWALDDLYENVRWPISIFGPGLRAALTVVFPLGVAITVPPSALLDRFDGPLALELLTVTAAMLVLSRWAWRRALARYASASS